MKKNMRSYLIVGVCLLLMSGCTSKKRDTLIEKHTLTGENLDPNGGPDEFKNGGDHPDSKYYPYYDYYNMSSTEDLTIIPKFKTFQQTTEFSCGAASAFMVANHFGVSDVSEKQFMEYGNIIDEGIGTDGVQAMFEKINFDVERNPDNQETFSWKTSDSATTDFMKWVQKNLKENTPIIVGSLEWSGHFQIIIGYDTMGTDTFADDVIIMADPYDIGDHYQDGYYVIPAIRFYYTWLEGMPAKDQKTSPPQPWVLAKPKVNK